VDFRHAQDKRLTLAGLSLTK